jgi:hypothetical protein
MISYILVKNIIIYRADGNTDDTKNCLTGWKCPDETPYCLKSKGLKLKGVCVYVVLPNCFEKNFEFLEDRMVLPLF